MDGTITIDERHLLTIFLMHYIAKTQSIKYIIYILEVMFFWAWDFLRSLKLLWAMLCLHIIIVSRTRFRVNLHSVVTWMSRNPLLQTGAISKVLSDSNGIRTHNHLVRKLTLNHLAKSTPCSYLNVKEYLQCCAFQVIFSLRDHFLGWLVVNNVFKP